MSTVRRWLGCMLLVASCSQPSPHAPRGVSVSSSERAVLDGGVPDSRAEAAAADHSLAAACANVPDATSALSRACFTGDVSAVIAHLANASANERPDSCQLTPFGEALAPYIAEPGTPSARVRERNLRKLEIANLLLDNGIDVRATDRFGSTALHHAAGAYYSERDVVRLVGRVLALQPDVNAQTAGGVTALFLAVEKGQVEVVRSLLEAGASPSLGTVRGATPLSVAEERGYAEIRHLLEARIAGAVGK